MGEEEIAKRFCKFESCTHRNGEGTCCLYNQDNCIFHRLEKENAELKKKIGIYQKGMYDKIEKRNKKLTKAIEIIREFARLEYADFTNGDYSKELSKVLEQAEQFLKGENIILEDAQAGNSPFDADEVFNKKMKAYQEEK